MASHPSSMTEPALGGEEARHTFLNRLTVAPSLWLVAQIAVPFLIAFAIYAPYIDDYFAMDDVLWLRAVDRSLLDVARRAFDLQAFTPYDAPTPFFRPAADITFKLEDLAFGLDPSGYHVVNLLLHATTAAVGGLLVAQVTRMRWAGLAVALLFVASPGYHIAVTWISQLSELMGACFVAAAVLAYHTYLTADSPAKRRWSQVAAFTLIVLAVSSKESQVTSLALFPALAFAIGGRRKRSWREIAPALVVASAALGAYLSWAYFHEVAAASTEYGYGLGSHMPRRFMYYLRWIVFPFGEPTESTERTLLATAYLATGVFAIVTDRRLAAFFFLWSLLAIAPFSLFKLVTQVRYSYLPTLPATAFLVVLAAEASALIPQAWRVPAATAGVAALVVTTAFFGIEARNEQTLIVGQARAHERLYADIRTKCADVSPGGTIYAIGYGIVDPFQVATSPGANLFLDRVEVRLAEPPGGAQAGPNVCVLRG